MQPNIVRSENPTVSSSETTPVPAVRPELSQAELLRVILLQQAARASRHGMPPSTYHASARIHGFDVSTDVIERELSYLLGKGFIASVPNELCPANERYRIHAMGTDYLAKYGYES
jgi:hypothetical protein